MNAGNHMAGFNSNGIARSISACLQNMNVSFEGQKSDQPGVAGKECNTI